MVPIKAKTLIGQVAEKSGKSEEFCKKIIEFFYKDLREQLSGLECRKIIVDKLGSFYIKTRVMENQKNRYIRIIENADKYPDTPRRERILRACHEQLILIAEIERQIKEDKERKEFFNLHKQTLLNEQTTGTNTEQEANS